MSSTPRTCSASRCGDDDRFRAVAEDVVVGMEPQRSRDEPSLLRIGRMVSEAGVIREWASCRRDLAPGPLSLKERGNEQELSPSPFERVGVRSRLPIRSALRRISPQPPSQPRFRGPGTADGRERRAAAVELTLKTGAPCAVFPSGSARDGRGRGRRPARDSGHILQPAGAEEGEDLRRLSFHRLLDGRRGARRCGACRAAAPAPPPASASFTASRTKCLMMSSPQGPRARLQEAAAKPLAPPRIRSPAPRWHRRWGTRMPLSQSTLLTSSCLPLSKSWLPSTAITGIVTAA